MSNQANLKTSITSFLSDRIQSIASKRSSKRDHTGSIVLHLVPVAALEPFSPIDIPVSGMLNRDTLKPIYTSEGSIVGSEIYTDGVFKYYPTPQEHHISSIKLYRNGIIEAIQESILMPRWDNGEKSIASDTLKTEIIKSLSSYIGYLQDLNVPTPVVVQLTLINAKGYYMSNRSRNPFGETRRTIETDTLELPWILIHDFSQPTDKITADLMELIHNAHGSTSSCKTNAKEL